MGSVSEYLEKMTGDKSVVTDVTTVTEEELASADRAIAIGGDGTVGRVLARLANREKRIPIGIIPAGTGNLLADCLGLKAETSEEMLAMALETIRNGRILSMDLGQANGTPFALDVAVGPIAMAVTQPGKTEKSSHGLFSYVRPLMKAMFERPYNFKIVADGVELECHASAIFVTNPQELGIGQRADVTTLRDGKLNLIILDPQNLDEYVGIAMRFGAWFLGSAETDNVPYRIFEVSNVSIEALHELSTPQLLSSALPLTQEPVAEVSDDRQPTTMLDGDVFGTTPVTVSIMPAAVDVYVPESTTA
jgi:diacylglycerol kinase family enzyme